MARTVRALSRQASFRCGWRLFGKYNFRRLSLQTSVDVNYAGTNILHLSNTVSTHRFEYYSQSLFQICPLEYGVHSRLQIYLCVGLFTFPGIVIR